MDLILILSSQWICNTIIYSRHPVNRINPPKLVQKLLPGKWIDGRPSNILLLAQDGEIETWPKKKRKERRDEKDERKFWNNFRDPSGSKHHHGLITIHRILQNFSSFFLLLLPPPSPPPLPRPVSVRTGKIKVRLSSQYCERGTNEIRAASGRISSFELARNSSRLYLVGGKLRPPPKGETQRIVADY